MSIDIKAKIKEKYGKIVLVGNTDSCCMPSISSSSCCSSSNSSNSSNETTIENSSLLSSAAAIKSIGYDVKELESIPVLCFGSRMWKPN